MVCMTHVRHRSGSGLALIREAREGTARQDKATTHPRLRGVKTGGSLNTYLSFSRLYKRCPHRERQRCITPRRDACDPPTAASMQSPDSGRQSAERRDRTANKTQHLDYWPHGNRHTAATQFEPRGLAPVANSVSHTVDKSHLAISKSDVRLTGGVGA